MNWEELNPMYSFLMALKPTGHTSLEDELKEVFGPAASNVFANMIQFLGTASKQSAESVAYECFFADVSSMRKALLTGSHKFPIEAKVLALMDSGWAVYEIRCNRSGFDLTEDFFRTIRVPIETDRFMLFRRY